MKGRLFFTLLGIMLGIGIFGYGIYSFNTTSSENQKLAVEIEKLRPTNHMLTEEMWNQLLDLLKVKLQKEEIALIDKVYTPTQASGAVKFWDFHGGNVEGVDKLGSAINYTKGVKQEYVNLGKKTFCALAHVGVAAMGDDDARDDVATCSVIKESDGNRKLITNVHGGDSHTSVTCAANCF